MIKAEAYGHGAVQVAKALASVGCESFGVALVEEGAKLKENGISGEVLVFGALDREAIEPILSFGLTPVISSWEFLKSFDEQAEAATFVHLKFNTGMNRLGFSVEDSAKLVSFFESSKRLKLKAVCSHFHSAHDLGENSTAHTDRQIDLFSHVVSDFSELTHQAHLYNSTGLIKAAKHFPKQMQYGARPGLALYGLCSHPEDLVSLNCELEPALELYSHIAQVQKVSEGEGVSYNWNWRAKTDSVIGVLPIGYGDGLPRLRSGLGFVLIQGHKVPLIGTICMDYAMVDLTQLSHEKKRTDWLGEEVILLGRKFDQEVSAEDWARETQSITWEVVTRISHRVPRLYET